MIQFTPNFDCIILNKYYTIHPIFMTIEAGESDQLVLQKRTGEFLGILHKDLTEILCHCLVTYLIRKYIFVPNMYHWIILRTLSGHPQIIHIYFFK
jgi:hypothetical protein